MGTVTYEEKENFGQIKERLRILLEKHLTNFRFVYPFGRPEGALKATISLLERVSIYTMVQKKPREIKSPFFCNFKYGQK